MLNEAQTYIYTAAAARGVPGLAIAGAVLGLNMLGRRSAGPLRPTAEEFRSMKPGEWTVAKIQTALARGETTAEAILGQAQAEIDRLDGRLNAIITANPEALEEARAIDRRLAAGETIGPLAGVPIVVKDTMDIAGLPTTGGWSKLSSRAGGTDLIPCRDSPVVARMRAAGAVILGKTNVPVMSASGTHANDSWAGPTLNAIALDRAPGGSSAGSAAAVAAGYAVIGLAEETGGSIQNPAAAQGLVGIKPSFALVPNAGGHAAGRQHAGRRRARWRAGVTDAAIALDVLAGYTPADPKTVAGIGHRPKGGLCGVAPRRRAEGSQARPLRPGMAARGTTLIRDRDALRRRAGSG